MNIKQLRSQWYTNQEGEESHCAKHLNDKNVEEEWRKQYWKTYEDSLFMKLKDWKYEKEYRLFLSNFLGLHDKVKDRKLKYKFEDLEAIIFGAKTSIEDKMRIIKIIESKCKENNRKSFDFYQANYSVSKGTIKISKINSISRK